MRRERVGLRGDLARTRSLGRECGIRQDSYPPAFQQWFKLLANSAHEWVFGTHERLGFVKRRSGIRMNYEWHDLGEVMITSNPG